MDKLYSDTISGALRTKIAKRIIRELSNITYLEMTNAGKNGRENILVDTVTILQKIVNLNISDSSLNVLEPANNILHSMYANMWRKTVGNNRIREQ